MLGVIVSFTDPFNFRTAVYNTVSITKLAPHLVTGKLIFTNKLTRCPFDESEQITLAFQSSYFIICF